MNISVWVVMNGYSMALAGVLFVASFRDGRSPRRICFSLLTATAFILLFADCLCRMEVDGTYAPKLIGSIIDFGFDGLLLFFWILYVTTWIESETAGWRERLRNPWVIAIGVFSLANLIAVIISIWTGWFFVFEADGTYYRGPYFLLRAASMFVFMGVIIVYVLVCRKKVSTGVWVFLLLTPVFTIAGGAAQALVHGLALEFCSFVFTMFLVYVFTRERSINVDALTGIGNRRVIDIVTENSARQATSGPSFSMMLVDLDLLKNINDTYGHEMGDKALIAVAGILRASTRAGDTIARYGGDEFFVVTSIRDREKLDALADRIREETQRFNDSHSLPCTLGVSIGYDIFDPDKYASLEKFKQHLDDLLYSEKEIHHAIAE